MLCLCPANCMEHDYNSTVLGHNDDGEDFYFPDPILLTPSTVLDVVNTPELQENKHSIPQGRDIPIGFSQGQLPRPRSGRVDAALQP